MDLRKQLIDEFEAAQHKLDNIYIQYSSPEGDIVGTLVEIPEISLRHVNFPEGAVLAHFLTFNKQETKLGPKVVPAFIADAPTIYNGDVVKALDDAHQIVTDGDLKITVGQLAGINGSGYSVLMLDPAGEMIVDNIAVIGNNSVVISKQGDTYKVLETPKFEYIEPAP